MLGMVFRLALFGIFASMCSYCILYADGLFEETTTSTQTPTIVRDVVTAAHEHNLAGVIDVPESCDELREQTQSLGEDTYGLVFETWQEPSTPCADIETPRVFSASLFSPTTTPVFKASLDGVPISVVVIPVADTNK